MKMEQSRDFSLELKKQENYANTPFQHSADGPESSSNNNLPSLPTSTIMVNREMSLKKENDDNHPLLLLTAAAAGGNGVQLLTENFEHDGSSCSEEEEEEEEIDDIKNRLTPKDWLEKFKSGSNKDSENAEKSSSLSVAAPPIIDEDLSKPNSIREIDQTEPKVVRKGGGGGGDVKKPVLSFQERYELMKKANQMQKPITTTSSSYAAADFLKNLPSLPPPPPPSSNSMNPAESQPYKNLIESVSTRRALTQTKVSLQTIEKMDVNRQQQLLSPPKNSGVIQEVTKFSRRRSSQSDKSIERVSSSSSSMMSEDEVKGIIEKSSNSLKPLLRKGIENLTIEDLATKDWNLVKNKAMKEAWSSCPLSLPANIKYQVEQQFESISLQYSTLWKYLDSSVVRPFEQTFVNNICLPSEQFEQIAENYRLSALDKIPEKLPQKIYQLLLDKMAQFINDYRQRNCKIQRMEDEFGQLMLSEAGRYYDREMSIILGDDYCDSAKLQNSHKTIYSETCNSFWEACSFKNSWWTKKYEQLLQDELDKILAALKLKNEDKKVVLEGQIEILMETAKQTYQEDVTLEEFRRVETKGREKVLNIFDEKTKSTPVEIVGPIRIRLVNCLDKLYNEKSAQVVAKQKEREQAIDKMQQEKTMMMLHMPYRQQFSPPRVNMPLKDLEKTSIAIHVGLHRTKIGYVDTQGQLHVIVDVQNCVYFDGQRMVSENEMEEGNRKRKSFCGDLMKNELSQPYQVPDLVDPVTGSKKDYFFRIEQLLSFLLATLKWEAELYLRKRIVDCLIVIPQSLNNGQREAVKIAATLARFNSVDLVNDTSAMALSYVMDKDPRSSQIITANLFEGYLDAASFGLVSGPGWIECVAISGDLFIEPDSSWGFLDFATLGLTKLLRSTKDSPKLSERAEKIFSMKELRAEDNSPSVLSVPDDFYMEVANHVPKYGDKLKVDQNYALMGASYLLCISSFGTDNYIYKKWLEMTQYQIKFQNLKNNLLLQCPTGRLYRKSKNNEKGRAMSKYFMEKAINDDFLHNQSLLHEGKLNVLKILNNVHSLTVTLSCDDATKMGIISQMDALYAKLLDPNLQNDELQRTYDNVQIMYTQFH